MEKKSAILVFVLLGLFFLGSSHVFAASGNPSSDNTITLVNPLGCDDLQKCIDAIITAIYTISIPIVSIMVLWGAFQILTAGGNPERLRTGGKTILYAAIGFGVVLLASGVSKIIESVLSSSP